MRLPVTVKIGEYELLVRWGRRDMKARGDVDLDRRVVRVRRGLSVKDTREVVIHELLHALTWDMSEEWVCRAGIELEEALERLGVFRG